MFRKTILALAAIATVGAAALAPTDASAGWKGKGWHGKHSWHGKYGWHGGYVSLYAPAYFGGCYKVKRIVYTSIGPVLKYVTVCG